MKKFLLFLTLIQFIPYTAFSQVPANDLIENATNVTVFPFEENVNINDASPPIAFSGDCLSTATPVVYYKFTATANTAIGVSISRELFSPAVFTVKSDTDPGANVIIYTASDSNISSETELTQLTSCAFGGITPRIGSNSKTIQTSIGVTYYIQLTNANISGLTTVKIEEVIPLAQTEKDALIDFYNSTGGPNWAYNQFWNSNIEVGDWHGVATHIIDGMEHVVSLASVFNNHNGTLPSSLSNLTELRKLDLAFTGSTLIGDIPTEYGNLTNLTNLSIFGSQLTGSIPSSFQNLTNLNFIQLPNNNLTGEFFTNFISFGNELSRINISGNQFSGLVPDFSGFSPMFLKIENNQFSFTDIETNHANNLTLTEYTFSPQNTLDLPSTINSAINVDIELTVNDTNLNRNNNETAIDNLYQWFKNNIAIAGANNNTYTIFNAQESDSGVFYCEITNTLVADLVIRCADITLNVDASLSIGEINDNDFKMYPNPANSWLTIQLEQPINAKISIYDLNGRLVIENSIQTEISSFAVDSLQAGTYLISITSNNNLITKRFIKH
jgi:hypothetical protein